LDSRLPAVGRDAGFIVFGWLAKIAVVLAVVGVIGFDGISVAAAHLSGTDDANQAASAAAFDYHMNHNAASALNAAADEITNKGEAIVPNSLSIDPDGSVHLLLRREATTLVLYRIAPLKKYTVITVSGEAPPPSS
jgi:hypothetical protein